MTLKPAQVRALLNAAELALYEVSRAARIGELTAVQVRGKISRTRSLRDKYQDLTRRQKLASRQQTGSKGGVSGTANQRTADKILVLTDVLRSFEERLERVTAAEERGSTKATARRAAPATTATGPASSKTAARNVLPATPGKKAGSRAPTGAAPSVAVKKSAATTLRELMGKTSTDGASSPEGPKPSSKTRRKPAPAGTSRAAKTDKTTTAGNAAYSRPGDTKIQGHSAGQARRAQVKRDGRG